MMVNSKENLLNNVNMVSFAMDEMVLYLDTHPCDKDALLYYKKLKKMRKEAVEQYEKYCGPLNKYDVDVENGWNWIEEPWPWEGVC